MMDLSELRGKAWQEYLEILERLRTVEKMIAEAKTRKDLVRLKLISDNLERRVRVLDRLLQRTDPLRMLQSMSYANVLQIVNRAELPEGKVTPIESRRSK